MANRRMFSLKVIDTDEFLDMPQTTQLLYYNLAMRADDDGFVGNPKKIMRISGCNDDDIKVLFLKKFVIPFESGICVIRHWRIHNYIQSDRYCQTEYLKEKEQLLTINNKYEIKNNTKELPNGQPMDNQMATNGLPNVSKMDTKWIRRLGKDRLEIERCDSAESPPFSSLVKHFFDKTNEVKHYKPEFTSKDGKRLKDCLKKYTPEQIKAIINWYLGSDKCKEHGATLSICLSADTINKWQENKSKTSWMEK